MNFKSHIVSISKDNEIVAYDMFNTNKKIKNVFLESGLYLIFYDLVIDDLALLEKNCILYYILYNKKVLCIKKNLVEKLIL
jgi:hypothetical protein